MAPEELLRLDSRDAVYKMAQADIDARGLPLNAYWYRISKPEAVTETLTSVTLYIDKAKAPVEHWSTCAWFTVAYHRIKIDDFVTGLTIASKFPTTHENLIRAHMARFNIPVSESDFKDRNVAGPGTETIVANEEGYRWVGRVEITTQEYTRNITPLIERNNVVTNFSPEYSSANIKKDIIAHLNRYNKSTLLKPLNPGNVQICLPIALDYDHKNNTKILIRAIGDNYEGEAYIHYSRRDFAETNRKPIVMKYRDYVTAKDLLADLSEKAKCVIVESDIDDIAITAPLHQRPLEYIIYFSETSLAYRGFIKVKLHA